MVGRPFVTDPPEGEPVSIELVKQALRIDTGDVSQDDYLNMLIGTAREAAEAFTSRAYLTQTIKEYYDCFPGCAFRPILDGGLGSPFYAGRDRQRMHRHLELSRSPLKALTSVQYKDLNGQLQTLDPSQFVLNDKQDPAQISLAKGCVWPATLHEVNAVCVTYTAGYSDDENLVPNVVKQAMMLMISDWDANRLPVKMESEAVTSLLLKNKVYYQP